MSVKFARIGIIFADMQKETECEQLCQATPKPTLGRLRPSSMDKFLVAMFRAALDIL